MIKALGLNMRIPKLIAGQMNVIRTVLKPGYAEGSRNPKPREAKREVKPTVVKIRKNERLVL